MTLLLMSSAKAAHTARSGDWLQIGELRENSRPTIDWKSPVLPPLELYS
jgi:hypothetical protein